MKKRLTLLLSLFIVLGSINSGFAAYMDINLWAVNDLNEGERYGLFLTDWYYDEFQSGVSADQLSFIRENIIKRFDEVGFERNSEHDFYPISEPLTRGDVALIYYDILSAYNWVDEMDSVTALQKLEVLKGTGAGLELDAICSVEQAAVMATRLVQSVFSRQDEGAKGLMWKVEHEEITLYLLGTIHTGNHLIYPMSNRVMQAFESSDVLILEALMSEEEIEKFQRQLFYPEGESIQSDLTEETVEKLEKVLALDGLELSDVDSIRAWHLMNQYTQVMITLMSSTDHDEAEEGHTSLMRIDHAQSQAELGIDNYFISKAQLSGMPMAQLESLEQQAILFNNLSSSLIDEQLSGILDFFLMTEEEMNEIQEANDSEDLDVDQVSTWINYWRKGDVEAFTNAYAPLIGEDEFSLMLFGKRDEQMAIRLQSILESGEAGTFFVAVGSGHYVVENSIIDHLLKMGYTVQVLDSN